MKQVGSKFVTQDAQRWTITPYTSGQNHRGTVNHCPSAISPSVPKKLV